ncbi:glutathione S-transferase family protein [Rhizorhabdus dicambivorans]|uniref:Glutathione S-transferase family protein n=1 Tax=Rhizorhabdus dicambivorans TaxID=1850238 RepID=A0A2A4FQ70_9SPHN|nr:glutathione S-transferase family protein [Rhizorhabdus dicambivorans]ATE65477.1 hypothetical protein CMV14_14585 [Rhizorhabdus dicambivorans]PCE39864.1 hypothetical protein COO09_23205 [Rhizorhabdus dicambivorans]
MLELYHADMSTCAAKVRCLLAEKGLAWEGRMLNLRAGDQHTPEFLALNPKAVIPVLVHDGVVVTESNIIMEYIEDAFPQGVSLMPANPLSRARVRAWMQRLDAGLHFDIAVLSIAVVIRSQLMAVHGTPEALDAYYAAIPDPKLRAIYQEVVPLGVRAPAFRASLDAWRKAMEAVEAALSGSAFLVGDSPTLADFAILPYVRRLEDLQMLQLWDDLSLGRPWLAHMKDTAGYQQGIVEFLNPDALALMQAEGEKAARDLLRRRDEP